MPQFPHRSAVKLAHVLFVILNSWFLPSKMFQLCPLSFFVYAILFPVNVPDISESARVNFFCFSKISHSFQTDKVDRRKPQLGRLISFSFSGKAFAFERNKTTNSGQTITIRSLHLNAKFATLAAFKCPPKLCHPRQFGRGVGERLIKRSTEL